MRIILLLVLGHERERCKGKMYCLIGNYSLMGIMRLPKRFSAIKSYAFSLDERKWGILGVNFPIL